MKRHSPVRKIIVATIFFIVLVIVAPVTVLYSMGYRFSKEEKALIHSGSVVLKTTPFDVNIKVSDSAVPQNNIDLINRSYNINGLVPGSYEVTVSANGYRTWKKQTEVHSGIATEFWNVVLVPENLEKKTLLESNVLKYSISPDKKNIGYFEQEDDYISLFVQEAGLPADQGGQNSFIYKEPVNQKFVPGPGELKWSPDSRYLIFTLKKGEEEEVYLVDSEKGSLGVIPIGELLLRSIDGTEIIAYSWDEQNNIYFNVGKTIYLVSLDKLLAWWEILIADKGNSNVNKQDLPDVAEIRKRIVKNHDEFLLTGDSAPLKISDNTNVFTLCGKYICTINEEKKALWVLNKNGEKSVEIVLPRSHESSKNYQIFAYSEELVALLDDKGNLFLWDDEQNKKEGGEGMKFIFSGVREVYFSDDGKKLLFATKNEAYVYSVREWEVQPKRLVGDLELIWAQPEEFKNIQWYLDYQNILVVNNNQVIMVELDERGGRNITEFLSGQEIQNAGYDTREKKFWFTEKGENDLIKLQEVAFPVTEGLFSGLMRNTGNQ